MTAMLFIASTGFTLFSHICLMDGEKRVSTQKMEDCCAHPDTKSTELNANCCIDNSTFLKFDYSGFTQKPFEITPLNFTELVVMVEVEQTISTHVFPASQDLPPPNSGRDILVNKQVFLI